MAANDNDADVDDTPYRILSVVYSNKTQKLGVAVYEEEHVRHDFSYMHRD